jgi:hypothetical protein
MYSKVHIFLDEHLSDNFRIQNGLKQVDVLSPLLSNIVLEYAIRKIRENRVLRIFEPRMYEMT